MAGLWGLRGAAVRRLWFLIPLRDLWATAVWAAGMFGHTVVWSGLRLKLDNKGRITNSGPAC